jgi:hypothetical protein
LRTLTEAEAKVVGALLATTLVTERARLKRAQVPRSTYHAARRRAYLEGWLRDRYIPNPVEFGLPFAAISLVRPYADRLPEFVQERSNDPRTVYLAAGASFALSIGFYSTREEAAKMVVSPTAQGNAGWSFPVIAGLEDPSVPVFFDFEGSFVHLEEATGSEGYPQGLGGRPSPANRSSEELAQRRTSWAARELVHRPFVPAEEGGREPHRLGPLGLPWSQQRMMNQGWIVHRTLLDPSKLPSFRGRTAEQLVIVVGTFRANARPEELFFALTRDCRVFPFLYVAAERRLVLGALGSAPGTSAEGDSAPPRKPVMATLQERVEGIEILQEPAQQFRTEIDHRYDRLFPSSGG